MEKTAKKFNSVRNVKKELHCNTLTDNTLASLILNRACSICVAAFSPLYFCFILKIDIDI